MKLNKNDINNLIDLIDEWENAEGLGCKELNENEVGFNHERLINFKKRLKKNESIFKKNESMFDFKKRLKKEININA